MIQFISILDPKNWIRFLIQIHFFGRSSLDDFKIQIQMFRSRFKFRSKNLDQVKNPESIFYKKNLNWIF